MACVINSGHALGTSKCPGTRTWPMYVDNTGNRRAASSPARYQRASARTAKRCRRSWLRPERRRSARPPRCLTEPGPFANGDRVLKRIWTRLRRDARGRDLDGARTLRAKIDMASGNINLRDPALASIKHVEHQNTGNDWPIYPMYDYAHSLSDAIEGINTHSLCTLELKITARCTTGAWTRSIRRTIPNCSRRSPARACRSRPASRARSNSRLNINYTVMSKRKLMTLVDEGPVDGWGDPRMPTLQGIRRRGYTPDALKLFVSRLGLSKQNLADRFRCWRTPCARISTVARRGGWRCSIR